MEALERQIGEWRAYLRRSAAITGHDAAELEDHLREQMSSLRSDGLAEDEAFLVAVKRIGAIDALTREFAREHSERLWKQLVLTGDAGNDAIAKAGAFGSRSLWVALALAAGAAAAVKAPALFGIRFGEPRGDLFYPLYIAFLVLPFIAAYFAWERRMSPAGKLRVAAIFGVAALLVTAFPYAPAPEASTRVLTAIHLPIALWIATVGATYVGGRWRGSERRMDFVRFTGELFIYYVLIALGGGVLVGTTFVLFRAIGVDPEPWVEQWILPWGAAGAALVAAWLVEAKQSVIENMAPVLTRVFAPLFTLLLLAFLATMALTGRGIDVEREVLIAFDLLLVVVFGLLLYTISARDPLAPPGPMDWIHLALVASALAVDALALWAVAGRISDFGYSPNRTAALGENVVLLVNLAGCAYLYAQFLRAGTGFDRLVQWQTFYLYVLGGWAAVVALLFPPAFRFA